MSTSFTDLSQGHSQALCENVAPSRSPDDLSEIGPGPYNGQDRAKGFVKVDVVALGKILDAGKASASAVHLLAIKSAMPEGYSLNKTMCRKNYGISEPRFKSGLRLLRSSGVLRRYQPKRRSFAVDRVIVADRAGGFIQLPRQALNMPSLVVGFASAAVLSPRPGRAVDVAARIGVTSRTTASRLAVAAAQSGLVDLFRDCRGTPWVGRRGIDFGQIADLRKNDPAKTNPTKTDPAHLDASDQLEGREKTKRECKTTHAEGDALPVGESDFEWLGLSHWCTPKLQELFEGWPGTNLKQAEIITSAEWHWWLDRLGPVPAHCYQGAAFKQATEIAYVIGAIVWCSPHEAIIAVAAGIGQAAARGRKIASLSFIAERLLRAALNGDAGPILNRRSLLPPDELKAVTALATDALERFRRAGVPVDADRLLGSLQTELLADLCRRYGVAAVEQGLAKSAEQPLDLPAYGFVTDWRFWEERFAEAAGPALTPAKARKGALQ